MGQKHSSNSLNLINLQKKVQAGDLFLISTLESLESDVLVSPILKHSLQYNMNNKVSVSTTKHFPLWDTAGIVVDMGLGENSGKSLLELTEDGFVVSEFLGRMSELKKKNHTVAVRFLCGERTQQFRRNLKSLADYLSGKNLDELSGTTVFNEIRSRVDDVLDDPTRESELFTQLKKAFYLTTTNPEDIALRKAQLHELVREFTGVRMDIDSETLAEELGLGEEITFEDFKEAWCRGPGRAILAEEPYEPSLLVGQFLRYVYLHVGVFRPQSETLALTPDDFATPLEFGQAIRRPQFQTNYEFAFSDQELISL